MAAAYGNRSLLWTNEPPTMDDTSLTATSVNAHNTNNLNMIFESWTEWLPSTTLPFIWSNRTFSESTIRMFCNENNTFSTGQLVSSIYFLYFVRNLIECLCLASCDQSFWLLRAEYQIIHCSNDLDLNTKNCNVCAVCVCVSVANWINRMSRHFLFNQTARQLNANFWLLEKFIKKKIQTVFKLIPKKPPTHPRVEFQCTAVERNSVFVDAFPTG